MQQEEPRMSADRNLDTARRYLVALEQGVVGADLAAFFDPEVVQEEFPNRLVASGARRDLNALLDGAVRGQQVLSAQTYAIQNALASGDQVSLEVLWTGTLAIALGSLPVGGIMRAHFAVFLEFRAGKIVAQRNYDCFEPW
jgi:ketosteroid isomerase-like protein